MIAPDRKTGMPGLLPRRVHGACKSLRAGGLVTDDVPPEQSLRLEQETLVLLVRGARTMVISSSVGIPLAAWLLQPFVGALWSWGIAGLLLLANAERLWFLRRAAPQALSCPYPRRQLGAIAWRLLLYGSLFNGWAYATILSPDGMAGVYMFAIALMAVMDVMLQCCVWPAAIWATATPLLLGLVWQLLISESDEWDAGKLVAAVFLFVLWIVLLIAAQRFAAGLQRERRTRLQNEELLAELERKREQAEAASAAKSRFLAAASHDLRQPVHAITLLGEALHARMHDSRHLSLVRQMLAGIRDLGQLVDSIMDVARIDGGRVEARMEPVDLSELAARVDRMFRAEVTARGLALWMRLPQGRQPTVHADATLLWRVISNLLSNALRYTDRGGVMLAVRRARLEQRPAWRLEVRDSGPGVSAAQHVAIFEEFFRGCDPHRSNAEGYGLGLPVARRMAALMGSELRLHPLSALGRGSVFSITLLSGPEGRVAAEPRTMDASILPALPRAPRVLVVDDNMPARSALELLLSGWGVPVQVAGGVRDAGRIARRAHEAGIPFQALLTDHWLADEELSSDVIVAVRPYAQRLCIAVVSGGADHLDARALPAEGIVFWRKPLQPIVLHAWLRQVSEGTLS